MHISLLPPLFDFLMSFLQISPQLIKVKQNSDFRSRGGVMGDKKNAEKAFMPSAIDLFWIHTRMQKAHPSPDTIGDRTASSRLAARSGSLESLECHPSTCPEQKWDDGGVCCNTHYPANSPVSAVPNSLELRALSPVLRCDNPAIPGNSNLAAKWWQTGWKTEQTWKMYPINAQTSGGSD